MLINITIKKKEKKVNIETNDQCNFYFPQKREQSTKHRISFFVFLPLWSFQMNAIKVKQTNIDEENTVRHQSQLIHIYHQIITCYQFSRFTECFFSFFSSLQSEILTLRDIDSEIRKRKI